MFPIICDFFYELDCDNMKICFVLVKCNHKRFHMGNNTVKKLQIMKLLVQFYKSIVDHSVTFTHLLTFNIYRSGHVKNVIYVYILFNY